MLHLHMLMHKLPHLVLHLLCYCFKCVHFSQSSASK